MTRVTRWLWPRSLAGQMVLLIATALFVAQAINFAMLVHERSHGRLEQVAGPVAARVLDVTRGAVRVQTGYLYHYAFAMLIGVAGFITWFMFGIGS